MATTEDKDEVKSEELDEEVENSQEEDETSTKDEETEAEDTEENEDEESDEDESEDNSETEEETEPEFKKRFTQFKGDSYEDYTPELEKAYGNVLGELTRLKQGDKEKQEKIDAITAAIAKDPELAKKLDEVTNGAGESLTTDPALIKARQDLNEQMAKDYKEFAEAHPEIETDPQLAEELLSYVREFGDIARKNDKILSMKDALKKAWILSGRDDSDEEIANKAKESASKPSTNSKKKKSEKSEFSEEQLRWAKKMGVTPEQLAALKN